MSLLERELSRRKFLTTTATVGGGIVGAMILGCREEENETAAIWSTINVPLNHSIRLEVPSLQSINIGMTDLFIYSSATEPWSWFTPVFSSSSPLVFELDFFLAEYKKDFTLNKASQLLGQPKKDLPDDSFLQAFGDLNIRFSDLDLQSYIGVNSVVYAIQRPETQKPHVFVYKHREDAKTSGFLKLKLTFQPQEIGFS